MHHNGLGHYLQKVLRKVRPVKLKLEQFMYRTCKCNAKQWAKIADFFGKECTLVCIVDCAGYLNICMYFISYSLTVES